MTLDILPNWLNEGLMVQSGLFFLAVATLLYIIPFLTNTLWLYRAAATTLVLSILAFISALVIRSINAEYFALSNMYESLLVTAIGILGAYVITAQWFKTHAIGWAACCIGLIVVFFAGSMPQEINPLQPALQSYWRAIHVPPMLLSYGFFIIASLMAAAYLITSHGKPEATLTQATTDGVNTDDTINMLSYQTRIDLYDEVAYRCIAAGFPLLTIGIILGGLWANEAWGNYWSWDPKESMSLVTLLVYGAYLHMRLNGDHSKRTLAWVAMLGFVVVMFTYVGVNVMGVGMHSYGSVKG